MISSSKLVATNLACIHCHLQQLLDDKKVNWRTVEGLKSLIVDDQMWSKSVVVDLFSLLIKQKYFVSDKTIFELAGLLDLTILEQDYLLELNYRNRDMGPESASRLCPETELPPL